MSLSTHNLVWWCMLIRENLSSSSLSLFTLIGSASSAAAEAAEACVASPPSLFDTIPMVVMVERWVRQLTGEQRSKLMPPLQKRLKQTRRYQRRGKTAVLWLLGRLLRMLRKSAGLWGHR